MCGESQKSNAETQRRGVRGGFGFGTHTPPPSLSLLGLVALGLLWTCGKLNDDGTPKAGYGPAEK